MVDTMGKTNEDVLIELLDMMNCGKKITIEDLYECISTRSFVDTIADENAVTIFYSGESGKVVTEISDSCGSKVCMIKRTEAFDFVNSDMFKRVVEYIVSNEKPEWNEALIDNEVSRLFNDASTYDCLYCG